jgi:ankyrin repeat protein
MYRLAMVAALAAVGIGAAEPDFRLVEAAKAGETGIVRALVASGADVNQSQADGTTALHWAAYGDDVEVTEFLVRAGARVNSANQLGVTPLWLASENGSARMVERLLAAGANPNAALPSGETPLMTAARSGSAEVARQLIASGASVNAQERARGQTALMWAAAQKHAAVVAVLLAHGADVRARSKGWPQRVSTTVEQKHHPTYQLTIQQGGYTPLLFAARVGDLASARLLVDAGADVNDTAPYGTSATVVAAHSGHGDVAALLLDKGADADADGAGYTALHAAILRHDEALVRALLVHGANPNVPVRSSTPARRQSADFHVPPAFVGASPFWLAARYGAPGIMRLLASHGADVHAAHNLSFWGQGSGYGVLAMKEGAVNAVMAAAGMGGRVASGEGLVPVPDPADVARRTLEAVAAAIELGVDVNAANADGNTALHTAALRGDEAVIRLLVEKGARLEAVNKRGQTPLAAASAAARPPGSTIELLRALGVKQ